MKKTLIASSLAIIFLASYSVSSFAEAISGSIIMRGNNKPVNEAKVVLQNLSGKHITSVTSDKEGKYTIDGVEPGKYRVTVYSNRTAKRLIEKDVVLVPGESIQVDLEYGKAKSNWGQFYVKDGLM